MRNPMLYVSRLRQAAEKIACTCDDPIYEECLKHATLELADEWFEVADKGGLLMMATYQLTGQEIGEWPWVIPAHDAFAPFHKNILTNDVT